MKRLLIVSAIVPALLIGVFASGSALAAPGHAPTFDTFDLTCAGETFTIVTQEHGNWTPGHIVGSKGSVLIPFSVTGTFTDTVTGDQLSFGGAKRIPSGAVTCTAHQEEVDPENGHLLVGDITAIVVFRGR